MLKFPLGVPVQDVLLIALLVLLIGLGLGAWGGYDYASALGDRDIATLKNQDASERLRMQKASDDEITKERGRADAAERLLDAAVRQHDVDAAQLRRRIDHVTTVYKPALAAPAVPLPRCVFTRGFVQHYNAAIGIPAVPEGSGRPATDAAPDAPAASGAELLDSGVRERDILAHIDDYGQRCRDLESQVNALLDKQGAP